ncbi:MAG TPA: tetratricopeptide repeat protein [Clostridia bacterium]|nr:tetratricopeptide repeat protein [Clostridia bacterium]
MALGFGFNKTKVLSSAEKFVQQGKLQNAITEYEKVVREDPKDLTVLNTIGDLNARIGQVDQAVTYFRRVGDAYATQGFTVKAIAMYKKLTKLSPTAIECVQKLAELYTQQGLYTDARSQYMHVADAHMRNGALESAAHIFQKLLELDPENASMQSKLADLYVRLGKKDEARNIYFRAAESLRQRNVLDACGEALGRVLQLDPQNGRALEMRGQVALETGDPASAIIYFEQLPDLDSRPASLRALLNCYLQQGRQEEAEPVARKLFTVHSDVSGMNSYAEMLIGNGNVAEALKLYDEFSDRLLATDPNALAVLHGSIARVKDDAAALDVLHKLFQKAGDTAYSGEIMELLAHACVQSGDLVRARDLYKELAEMEPENPLHTQNHKQVLARLGQDALVRPMSVEQGGKAFMVDELEPVETVLEQHYSDSVADALQTALTEAELFDSYNVPAKAIPPLESVLPLAPFDVRVNQRLASLYARSERFEDAARACSVLHTVYSAAGHTTEANQYADMAARYAEKAGIPVPQVTAEPAVAMTPLPDAAIEATEAFSASFEMPSAIEETAEPVPVEQGMVQEFTFDLPAEPDAVRPLPTPEVEPAAALSETHEFDLSDEWETIVSADIPPLTAAVPEVVPAVSDDAAFADVFEDVLEITPELTEEAVDPAQDIIDEARFYISQAMWAEAAAAIDNLAVQAPEHPLLVELHGQLPAKPEARSEAEFSIEVEPVLQADDAVFTALPAPEPRIAEFFFEPSTLDAVADQQSEPLLDVAPSLPTLSIAGDEPSILEVPLEPVALQAVSEPEPLLELPLATAVLPVTIVPPVVEPALPPVAAPVETPDKAADVLGNFVLDLEGSLGEDFVIGAKGKPTSAPEPAVAQVPAIATTPAPLRAVPQAAPAVQEIAAAISSEVAFASGPAPTAEEQETSTVLADMFAEFKDDVEEDSGAGEDPDTHYNLGVAFKEMGLLDEAIGELQKVALAIDHGQPFAQVMQAYTWLANCFVEKGVPEAALKWYDKALKLAPDGETSTAIHYELACAHELSGDRALALTNFMEVYGSNIDYRDVAERIKALKS